MLLGRRSARSRRTGRHTGRLLFAAAVAGGAVLALAAPAAAQVPGEPWSAYAVNNGDDTVSVIDTATNTVTTTIDVGDAPDRIAVTPDQAPVARLAITPAPAGQATSFDASASTVQFNDIATYTWDFGDGSPPVTTTTPTTTHVYAAPGNYPVTLILTSSGGTSTTQVFTGQTTSRNGGPQATTTATATIPAAVGGGGGGEEVGLPVTGPAVGAAVAVGLLATAIGAGLLLLSRRARARRRFELPEED